MWSWWRNTAGPDLGVVAADALEDARAVVQAVRQYVNLRVLPCDELAVHPDEVRLLHVVLPYAGGRALPGWPRRSSRRHRGRGCAARRAAPGPRPILGRPPRHRKPRPWRSSIATDEEHRQRVGDRPGRRCPAPSRAPARRRPGVPGSPSDALGSIPIEPVSIAASSLRMSPNMFSVTITSKSARRRRRAASRRCRRARARARRRELLGVDVDRRPRATAATVSSTLALSTLVDLARARRRTRRARCARSPRRCRRRGRSRSCSVRVFSPK